MKLIAQKCLKVPILVGNLFHSEIERGYQFLIYHNVSGGLNFELDMPRSLFRQQMEYLARRKRVVSYDQALTALQSGVLPDSDTFVLTFDDGYQEFYTQVFPLLRDLQLPAILFVTTGFIESGIPYPILNRPGADVRPVSWDMLGEMIESGLVTVGAHTHTHPVLVNEPEARVIDELAKPLEIFRKQLGIDVHHFAYPKARWNQEVERLVSQYYLSAVICEEKRATAGDFHPLRIPRIPIRRSDGWFFFLAKIRGWLEGEEAMYDKLRNLRDHQRQALNSPLADSN